MGQLISRVSLFGLVLVAGCRSPSATGSWTGSFDGPGKLGVRYVLEERGGALTGTIWWGDGPNGEFQLEGGLAGTVVGGVASWKTEGAVEVRGRFEGDVFVGTLTFPATDDEPAHTAALKLSR